MLKSLRWPLHLQSSSSWVLPLLLLPGALHAQQPPDTAAADTVYAIDELVVTSQRRAAATGGASALRITVDSLDLRPVATVEDALRALPFILVRQNSRGSAEISVRGSESRQVAILLDGVPLTLAWDHRTDPAVVPLMGAQNLIVVRGLPSVLSGPNVLGGVVEVDVARVGTTQNPVDELRAVAGVDQSGAYSLGVTGSRVDEGMVSRTVIRGGLGYRARDGFELASGVQDPTSQGGLRTNSDLQMLNGFAALHTQGESGRWLSVSASGFRAERGVAPELHLQEPRRWRYPEEWQAVGAVTAGTGQRETRWGTGDIEASLGLNLVRQSIEQFGSLAYQTIEGTERGEGRTATLRLLGDHSLGTRGTLRGALTWANVSHTEVLDETERNEYQQRLWSAASEVRWRLPALTRLTAGIALDGASTPKTGGKPALGSLSAWGGRLGVTTLGLRSDLQLHGSVSSRARFPALRELYSGSLGRFEPNPDLAPERLVAGEVGATFKKPGVEVQATLFRHRLSDAVVRATTATGQFIRINRDEIRSAGLELLVGTSFEQLEVLGDLTLQRVRVEDQNSGVGALEPEHMPEFRAGLDFILPLPEDVQASARFEYTGNQFCVHPEMGTDVELGSSGRIDVATRRSFQVSRRGFWRRLAVSLSLDNLTDSVAYDQCGMPQAGRTFRVGLELN